MRTYTFTLKDETEYEVGIDAKSETEAEEILEKMDKKEISKYSKISSDMQIISVSKDKTESKVSNKKEITK
tara:strand:- start:28 stop:240 length:213 start_codon:yes stop_codon:yes gene_type:complete